MPDKNGYLTPQEYDDLEWERTGALTHEDICRIFHLTPEGRPIRSGR